MKKLAALIGITIGICTLIGIILTTDSYFAKASEVKMLEYRVDQKIIQDYTRDLQERIWKIEDRFGTDCSTMPEGVRTTYRELKAEKELQDKILDEIIKKVQEKKN